MKNNLINIDLNKIKKKEEEAHRSNLTSQRDSLTEDIEKYDIEGIMRDRLIAVLKEANAVKTLKIDETLDEDTLNQRLIDEYHKILALSTKGFCVRLKRDISECFINNFSHEWISIFNSNMDLSPAFDFYSIICYIGEYVLKGVSSKLCV